MTQPTGELNGIPFTHRFVTDEAVLRRLTRTLVRVQLVRPVMGGALELCLAEGVLSALIGQWLGFALVGTLVTLLVVAVVASSRRSIRRALPVGPTVDLGFGSHSFVVLLLSLGRRLRRLRAARRARQRCRRVLPGGGLSSRGSGPGPRRTDPEIAHVLML